jgi:autotransporter-associated beta strand protein
MVAAGAFAAGAAGAAEQVWNDAAEGDTWSTNAPNWDAGAAWANGNSAVFSGGAGTLFGEAVDLAATVTVANITFQTNGYVIADADNDGSLSILGAPSVITVVNAGDTGTLSRTIGGSGGFTKAGDGVLALTATNTYSGTTTVSAGVLRLAPGVMQGLGATGTGNNTVVAANATLDFNGCYVNATSAEQFSISGSGTDGKGVLVNTGPDMTNRDLGWVTLLDDAVIGGAKRIDIAGVTGNNKRLTKRGTLQMCVKNLAAAEIVINEGIYTLLGDNRALGGTTWGDTTVNGGTLNAWNTMTVPERITFNGGTIAQGNISNIFYLSGPITVNSNTFVNSASTRGVEISGFVGGPGGFTQAGSGWFYVTCETNTYSGPTTINGGCPLYVGRTNLYAGVLGSGTVTNNGNLYAYSSRICPSNIVNNGSLYLYTGLLSTAGSVVNNGSLYIDRGGAFACSNAFFGSGTTYLRYGGEMTISGSVSSNAQFRMGMGTLTLTNGADFRCYQEMQVADRLNLNYPVADPSNLTSVINVPEGCTLTAQAITFGNGVYGSLTGILNHAGGVVRTTGTAAEGNGIRLGHYPVSYCVYNMMGGTLTIGADWDLSCATDGRGWFNMSGGEAFAKRVMLNERGGDGGYGRLTVSGGVLNVGSLTGSTVAISNGIVADPGADYLVEFGGSGGTVRAVTHILISVTNTLYGVADEAITFDSAGWDVQVSGSMTGPGGFNKVGAGTLLLSGTNTYSGATRLMEGTLTPAAGYALSTNSVVAFGVSPDGSSGRLHVPGDLSLAGLSVGVANPEQLDKFKSYTVVTYGGELTGAFGTDALPEPWHVYYNWDNKRVELRAAIGTLLKVR